MRVPIELRIASALLMAVLLLVPAGVRAQSAGRAELGGQLNTLRLSEFDVTDVGVGLQAGWRLTPVVSLDGSLTWFPDGGDISSSLFQNQQRVLGTVGLRAALRRGPVEVFAKARPGFMRFDHQDSAVCIAIAVFPVPLGCQLATGYTALAFDVGSGVLVTLDRSGRTYFRIDAGDLMLRYGLEAYRPSGDMTEGFVGHNFVVNVGIGRRF